MNNALEPGARARATFRGRFGADPQWMARAPGRVNLIGEHTDYNAGFVLPIAIDRDCIAAAGPAPGPLSIFISADTGDTWEVDLGRWAEPEDFDAAFAPGRIHRGSWASYIYGVLRLLHARLATDSLMRPVNLVIASSVPLGGGLSSSASLEVAACLVGEQMLGMNLPGPARAALCREAEHRYAGVPCGIMDQLISVLGRENHALLIDCRDESARAIPMPPASEAVVVVMNSGVRHALAGGEYAARKAACERAAAGLGIATLREATRELLERRVHSIGEEEFRCARHIITENTRTLAAAEALARGNLAAMGRLMNESHASLRHDYRVSCPELDCLVETAQQQPGVFGARMTGAGFGGCAIALVRPEDAHAAVAATAAAYAARHGRELSAFPTSAQPGAARL
ncbi:MAG: galactokinase [Phycisphaerales bacterium]|nr:galactokinase [Phycisphaerales bacterium]